VTQQEGAQNAHSLPRAHVARRDRFVFLSQARLFLTMTRRAEAAAVANHPLAAVQMHVTPQRAVRRSGTAGSGSRASPIEQHVRR